MYLSLGRDVVVTLLHCSRSSCRTSARIKQIKASRILPKALDPEEENEPVTATRKVKRALMYERTTIVRTGCWPVKWGVPYAHNSALH